MERRFLRPPQLRTKHSEEEERHATWIELFYDLIFVVAVASLGHRLLSDLTLGGVLGYVGLFIPLWWAWAGFTFYADRYDTDDLGQRTLAVAQIISIAFLAVSIKIGHGESTMAFALAYAAARTILVAMYLRVQRHVAETRALVTGYIRGYVVEIVLFVISAFVPSPWRYVIWAVALAISFATPYVMRQVQAKVPLSVSHLPERFGLFTILVLGESIAAVVAGLSEHGWDVEGAVSAALAVGIASGMWWLYFDNLDGKVVRRDPNQKTAWKPTVWIYSHLPLAISLTAAGIGLEFVVAQHLDDRQMWLLLGALAAAHASLASIHLATAESPGRRDPMQARVRLLSGAGILLLGFIGLSIEPWIFGSIIAAIVAAEVWIDVRLGLV